MGRIDELIEAVAEEVASDTSVLLDDSVAQRQLAIDRLVDLATALSMRNLVELDRRKLTDAFSGQATAEWVALTERVAPGLARRRLRTAHRLAERLAETDAAWVDGRLNHEHVRVIADAAANLRVGERIVELQADLIRLAGELTFSHWRQMVIYLVRELDEDGAFDPDAELERNHASLAETLDGNCVLQARFDRVRYHRVKHHIEAKTDELFRHHAQRAAATGGELRIPSRPCLRALAIHELIEAGAAADGAPTVTGTQATVVLTPAQLPHDHPRHRCPPARSCGGAPAAGQPTPDASGADPAARLGTGLVDGWRAWTLDGTSLPGAAPDLAALLCDATLEALIVDADATPLALGRSRRLFTAAQRRAQAIRDGGCVLPGCTVPASATRAHHVRFWHRDSGPTDVDNGASLCDRDHGIPHRAGWDMFLTADGWCWFRSPSGRSFWGQRHGHQRTGPTPDQPGYVEPPSRPAASIADRPTEGRAPPTSADGDAVHARPALVASRLPVGRRRDAAELARSAAALTERRIRLRRDADIGTDTQTYADTGAGSEPGLRP